MVSFNVIYADPPWAFRNKKTGGSHQSGSAQKYAVLSTRELCEVPVPNILAPEAIGFIWVPSAMLIDGLTVLAAWGFRHRGALYWIKSGRKGTGYWFRNKVEILLFGIHGDVRAFRSTQDNAVEEEELAEGVETPVLGHSVKPELFRLIIEGEAGKVFAMPRGLELFARRPVVAPWVATGLELDGLDVKDPDWIVKLPEL